MAYHTIAGAGFDSSERDNPPRCHPGTRTLFLEQLRTRIHDNTLGTRIIWLFGPAGVGKSAIMQTVAETLAETESPKLPFSTLFFSRPNQRDDPKKVFNTLAYGFAVVERPYLQFLEERLAADPGFFAKSIEEQFKRLFIMPFANGRVRTDSRRWVVLLDGLDECNDEREQCKILDVIYSSIIYHTQTTPFIWIIASRPEAHLRSAFAQIQERCTAIWTIEIPIDTTNAV